MADANGVPDEIQSSEMFAALKLRSVVRQSGAGGRSRNPRRRPVADWSDWIVNCQRDADARLAQSNGPGGAGGRTLSIPGCSCCHDPEHPVAFCPAVPRPGRRVAAESPALLAVLARDEHVVARELLEDGRRLTEIGCQHVGRVTADPLGEVDVLVDARVKADEDIGTACRRRFRVSASSPGKRNRRRPSPGFRSGCARWRRKASRLPFRRRRTATRRPTGASEVCVAPGWSSRIAPVMVFEIGNLLESTSHSRPPVLSTRGCSARSRHLWVRGPGRGPRSGSARCLTRFASKP